MARYSLLFHVIWQFLSVDDEADVAELIAEVKIGRINAVRAKAYAVTGIWNGEAVFPVMRLFDRKGLIQGAVWVWKLQGKLSVKLALFDGWHGSNSKSLLCANLMIAINQVGA